MCKIRVGKALGGRERRVSQAKSDTCLLLAGNKNQCGFPPTRKGMKDSGKSGKIKYFVKLENVLTGFTEAKIYSNH